MSRKRSSDRNNTQVNTKDIVPSLQQLNKYLKRMPSASAKIEKIASPEAADPIKQFHLVLEKKVRNLEKRKLKLDNYRSDVKNGKELNEDQKSAVNKYDQVVELLEYSKELCKSLDQITIETSRAQKKLAKKEQIERQRCEIQRLQEALYYKHVLSCLENGEAREDFLNGSNGAIKLSVEDMHQLDQLYKLIEPSFPNEHSDVESHFRVLSENLIFLVEGKNKEVAGTTYKHLKDLLVAIKDSGYFSKPSESNEEVSSDDAPELDTTHLNEAFEDATPKIEEEENFVVETTQVDVDVVAEEIEEEVVNSDEVDEVVPDLHKPEDADVAYAAENGSLQEVLPEGSFNFLQESQIELDVPHMDPAIVAVHQLPPHPPYPMAPYSGPPPSHIPNGIDHAVMAPMTSAPQVVMPHNSSPDFDPNHPIPTQTYTNQSFTVMQNMMIPSTYVPVTMHHGPLPPHLAQVTVLPATMSPPTATVAVPVTVTAVESTQGHVETNSNIQEVDVEHEGVNGNVSGDDVSGIQNGANNKTGDEGFNPQNNYQRGYRPRGRGRGGTGGYYRPRGGFNNGGRGGYLNHGYYQGNFRRGGPRGGGRGNNSNNIRGGGRPGYRPPPQQTQQQQQDQ